MTRRFILRSRDEHDIQSDFEWYESRLACLGDEFLAALRQHLEAIRSLPESNPILYRDAQWVSRFPYLIFYVVRPRASRSSCRSPSRAQSRHMATQVASCPLTPGGVFHMEPDIERQRQTEASARR